VGVSLTDLIERFYYGIFVLNKMPTLASAELCGRLLTSVGFSVLVFTIHVLANLELKKSRNRLKVIARVHFALFKRIFCLLFNAFWLAFSSLTRKEELAQLRFVLAAFTNGFQNELILLSFAR